MFCLFCRTQVTNKRKQSVSKESLRLERLFVWVLISDFKLNKA